MRPSLRRSCAACAKSKHSCDLRTPRCSRCNKRKIECVYANQPLTASLPSPSREAQSGLVTRYPGSHGLVAGHSFGSLDPFESYPQTKLSRAHVQRLIHSFLHKIAFQYYPLDLDANSNPFLVSWWPLALGDPALFHVSLQTACLDEERSAQKGFESSEILMADSVVLLRHKIEDAALAIQDGTINTVITLATIEFGKGNIDVSQMHISGVKRLVDLRGGINAIRQTSPLTARMVSWVSMLIMGKPQFPVQTDDGVGSGIPPIPEWHSEMPDMQWHETGFGDVEIDLDVAIVLVRLRGICLQTRVAPLPTARLHDLTCYVIHRLLLSDPEGKQDQFSPATQAVRYAIILYMLVTHGPTYYPHDGMLHMILSKFRASLEGFKETSRNHGALDVWLIAVGMVVASNTPHYQWFATEAQAIAMSLQLVQWHDILQHMHSMIWIDTPHGEAIFRPHWLAVLPRPEEVPPFDNTWTPAFHDTDKKPS